MSNEAKKFCDADTEEVNNGNCMARRTRYQRVSYKKYDGINYYDDLVGCM